MTLYFLFTFIFHNSKCLEALTFLLSECTYNSNRCKSVSELKVPVHLIMCLTEIFFINPIKIQYFGNTLLSLNLEPLLYQWTDWSDGNTSLKWHIWQNKLNRYIQNILYKRGWIHLIKTEWLEKLSFILIT